MFGKQKQAAVANNQGRQRNVWGGLLRTPQAPPASVEPLNVTLGVIGRGHAGKTALFRALYRGTIQDNLPSQLQLDVDDPLATAKMVQDARTTYIGLRDRGLPPTLEPEKIEYQLFEGDTTRAVFSFHEVVGQILTHTTPDSPPEQKEKYGQYVSQLSVADVLWVVVPCPPHESSPDDLARYEDDLRIASSYLREALRVRKNHRPCSIGIVLTKVDSLFSSADEAKSQMSADKLMEVLRPLVNMILVSDRAAHAAIFPISAFGWGNAVINTKEESGPDDANGSEVSHWESGALEHGELEWILKPGVLPEPFNLTPLVVWSVLCGMLHQEVEVSEDHDEHALARVCHLLSGDLEQLEGWYVPFKGALQAV